MCALHNFSSIVIKQSLGEFCYNCRFFCGHFEPPVTLKMALTFNSEHHLGELNYTIDNSYSRLGACSLNELVSKVRFELLNKKATAQ